MIKLNNIEFFYGEKKVLDSFSLDIKKGDRICLFGPSGCGKTTVLRLILGLESSKNGSIETDKNFKPSVVFQEDRLLPFKTVLQNITLFGADKNRTERLLAEIGLKDYLNSYSSELSGGMCRRVAIARALAVDFDYLVLDEPFTGLDQSNIDSCAELINEILGDRPLILVTHSKAEAEMLGCRLVGVGNFNNPIN